MKLLAIDRKAFNFIQSYLAANGGVGPSFRVGAPPPCVQRAALLGVRLK